MNRKTILYLIVFLLLVVMMGAAAPVAASPTTFYLDPSTKHAEAGDQFTLTLRVDAVTDIYLWVADIEWNPTYFDMVGDPVEGESLKSGGSTTFLWASTTDGKIDDLTCSLLGEIPGVDVPPAPSDMATVTFYTQERPPADGTTISITFARHLDSADNEYTPTTEETLVVPPPVGGVWIPVDKLALLAPYITSAVVVVAIIVGTVYAKKRWFGKAVVITP